MHADVGHAGLKQRRHVLLGEPDTLALETHIELQLPVLGLIYEKLAARRRRWLGRFAHGFRVLRSSLGQGTDVVFMGNCFYGHHPKDEPEDKLKLKADPKFKDTPKKMKEGQLPEYFHLSFASPCLQKGQKLSDNGGLDFWGNVVDSEHPSIGTSEK